jgi:hypothetical protein
MAQRGSIGNHLVEICSRRLYGEGMEDVPTKVHRQEWLRHSVQRCIAKLH